MTRFDSPSSSPRIRRLSGVSPFRECHPVLIVFRCNISPPDHCPCLRPPLRSNDANKFGEPFRYLRPQYQAVRPTEPTSTDPQRISTRHSPIRRGRPNPRLIRSCPPRLPGLDCQFNSPLDSNTSARQSRPRATDHQHGPTTGPGLIEACTRTCHAEDPGTRIGSQVALRGRARKMGHSWVW
jgi:hypothetical protein